MSRRTCDRCGFVGDERAIRTRLVFNEDPLLTLVEIPVSFRRDAVLEQRIVPELYSAEWQCADVAACDVRVASAAAQRPSEVDVAEFFAGVEPEARP